MPAATPEPPYVAVVFTSVLSADAEGYERTAERMLQLARGHDGFLGSESARGDDGVGITVSYWRDQEALRSWRRHVDHVAAQERGRSDWYTRYVVRVAVVERAWDFHRPAAGRPGTDGRP